MASAALRRKVSRLISHKTSDADSCLKAMGCPYTSLDPRSLAWIEGYKAALAFAETAVME